MFQWYAQASVCYVFLHDVDDSEDPAAPGSSFRRSRWFTRGWTLQELVAPRYVAFFSRDWTLLGTKDSLAVAIEAVTHISTEVLTHDMPLNSVSVAERMSWASERTTTRIEDRAYSLLGIFGIHLPTIYGEGHQSFIRLQEEILRRIPDQTLFAWGRILRCSPEELYRLGNVELPRQEDPLHLDYSYLLAPSPTYFRDSADYSPLPLQSLSQKIGCSLGLPQYTMTSYGVRTTLPVWSLALGGGTEDRLVLAILACCDSDGALLSIIISPAGEPDQYLAGTGVSQLTFDSAFVMPLGSSIYDRTLYPRMMMLDKSFLLLRRFPANPLEVKTIFILHRPLNTLRADEREWRTEGFRSAHRCEIILPPWTRAHLQGLGFAYRIGDSADQDLAWDGRVDLSQTNTFHLTLLHIDTTINIYVSLCSPIRPSNYIEAEKFPDPWALHVEVTVATDETQRSLETSTTAPQLLPVSVESDGYMSDHMPDSPLPSPIVAEPLLPLSPEGVTNQGPDPPLSNETFPSSSFPDFGYLERNWAEPAECPRRECHVDQWQDGSKNFHDVLQLTFSNWRSVRGAAHMSSTGSSFALDIQIKEEAAHTFRSLLSPPHILVTGPPPPDSQTTTGTSPRRRARQVHFNESVRVELYHYPRKVPAVLPQ